MIPLSLVNWAIQHNVDIHKECDLYIISIHVEGVLGAIPGSYSAYHGLVYASYIPGKLLREHALVLIPQSLKSLA